MSIVKVFNKKTGTTYVYESESYWDPEKKQPRNKRKLIGKLDENGEIVPTGKKGQPQKETFPLTDMEKKELKASQEAAEIYQKELIEVRNELFRLKEQVRKLEKEKLELLGDIRKILEKHQG